ncbi:MAG: ferritin-like domain-containing protein [Chloroflexota bacterium]
MSIERDLAAAAQQSESVSDIINIASTAEAMAVTLLGAAIAGASGYDGGKGLAAPLVTILKAAQAAEQAHYNFLTGAGAKPLTLTFNIPDPKIATDSKTLFSTIEALETAFISAYEAAALEFAQMRSPGLVKVAVQIGGTEAEHRALARLAQGDPLPHNVAFEATQFSTVGDAAAALEKLGFIGGSGTPVKYQDFTGKVDFSGVMNLTPGGVAASTAMAGTAPSGGGAMPASMPRTGGIPLGAVIAAGAGLALVGTGLRKATK